MFVPFDCRSCGEQNEVEVEMTSRGSPGSYGGPPWECCPAEPAEWETVADVTCECGTVHDSDWFGSNEVFDKEVQQRAVDDRPEPYESDYSV